MSKLFLSAGLFAATITAIPTILDGAKYFSGFDLPTLSSSQGGKASCISGFITVSTSYSNTVLNYQNPTQLSLTETIVEFLQVDSTLASTVLGSKVDQRGSFKIHSKLCYPQGSSLSNASSIQFLTHGVGFDKSYWDFYSSQYSYVDYMASKGYATFSYDRLGTGLSAHPDPIQTVQAQLEVNIAHSLIGALRSGAIASTSFKKIIGVGHSLGSEVTVAIASQYPSDMDAAVLTGFSVSFGGFPSFFSALNLQIASQNDPLRFGLLPNGYGISQSKIGNQFAFFRHPNFDSNVLDAAERAKQTFTVGELFTNSQFITPAPNFKGPIDVVIGENDLPFCQSNCLSNGNRAAEVQPALFPAAGSGSDTYTLKGVGHGLNLHYGAGDAYAHIAGFVKKNGL